MSLPVVLTCKSLATDGTDKGSLIRVRAQMRTKIIGSCKFLRTEVALKGRCMFLPSVGTS